MSSGSSQSGAAFSFSTMNVWCAPGRSSSHEQSISILEVADILSSRPGRLAEQKKVAPDIARVSQIECE